MENIREDLLFTTNTDCAPLRKYFNIRYYRTRPSVFKLTQLLSTNKITLVNTYILHTTKLSSLIIV